MKKLAFASVALVGVCCSSIACSPLFAQGADGQAAAQGANKLQTRSPSKIPPNTTPTPTP